MALQTFVLLLPFSILGGDPFWVPVSDSVELASAVAAIDSLRNGRNTDFDRLEMTAKNLLTKFEEPEQRGILLFHHVNVYAQTGMLRREVMLRHAEEALVILKEPSRRAALHVLCGDAIRLSANNNHNSKEVRRIACSWYLRGLNEVMRMELPKEAPEYEIMSFFDIGDPALEAKLHEEQKSRFLQKQLQRIMIRHRDVLVRQVLSLYKAHEDERSILEDACRNILHDEEACKSILSNIRSSQKPVVPASSERLWRATLLVINCVIILSAVLFFLFRKHRQHSGGGDGKR